MQIKIISLLFLALLFLPGSAVLAHATENTSVNYCRDESSWFEWHTLLEKHPNDDSIVYLYALRRGLCSLVESGNIEIGKATSIFEGARQSVMDDLNRGNLKIEKGERQPL